MTEHYTPAIQKENAFDELITRIAFDETPPTPTMTVFDIVGVSKPALFLALYNAANDNGYNSPIYQMTIEKATRIIEGGMAACCYRDGQTVFDEYNGRNLYFDLSGDELDITEYDNYNGEGTAFKSIKTVLAAIDSGYIAGAIEG